ncbi:hypothetical protein A3I56_01755 [Candidatus Roizmanbacteria bacterium RIFCSPLOWO2_02_FULL_43_10]|uniref:Uncharacterized protein n=3 Tax=Candidatus Roizmaniibacteriota TaxID=1752723 RepID=A0A1F7JU05_9BACT|nr:MAG: hypothetical protein A3D08_00855 [Candidatus Roizmanbacteria bacterium RIFCSPHIGHO2_02_FULL_43_11]OGK38543.1 MAG: hypothetical protein A3F32_01895 [Candidatus Roizmanbacteria bacterium RIFCSPHIGHO2_12_FULL_42_10]OGK59062.1 MAG: hypothetical protein A3I56_01755 [Candidatus Roizmanbacteria bacterium RIFCSPLOWO2_02_FULL_43_10]
MSVSAGAGWYLKLKRNVILLVAGEQETPLLNVIAQTENMKSSSKYTTLQHLRKMTERNPKTHLSRCNNINKRTNVSIIRNTLTCVHQGFYTD